ncbi:uncharacterized protein LY79DRAFT_2932 [Colletotrichum navitas]|uniref:Uncharacterized protein n=1 Tax=Colletotrichum navitas TaxID=681940 RepID=A0AAD8QDG2_9PEZI|nr:uncharacterized protein LY79DRAFT_2932 [Colletotrichum navitas]KAK1599981.1 hypothetical protein LY79DRAFT_2932 [Colletotrichum navitas]
MLRALRHPPPSFSHRLESAAYRSTLRLAGVRFRPRRQCSLYAIRPPHFASKVIDRSTVGWGLRREACLQLLEPSRNPPRRNLGDLEPKSDLHSCFPRATGVPPLFASRKHSCGAPGPYQRDDPLCAWPPGPEIIVPDCLEPCGTGPPLF